MTRVITDISMSLDGFVTGPDPDLAHGLGRGGEAIQQWVFASHDSPEDRAFLEGADDRSGAVVMGRRTFDFVDGPHGWNEEIGYSYDAPASSVPPIVVVTHEAPTNPRHRDGFTFVTGGIEAAVARARELAGQKDVTIMGGGATIAGAIAAGLVDDVRVHLSPVLMGAGTRLFDLVDSTIQLVQTASVATPNATHLTYEVAPAESTERTSR